jgi:hypothetical protein
MAKTKTIERAGGFTGKDYRVRSAEDYRAKFDSGYTEDEAELAVCLRCGNEWRSSRA